MRESWLVNSTRRINHGSFFCNSSFGRPVLIYTFQPHSKCPLSDRAADLQLIGRLKECISANHKVMRNLGRETVQVNAALDAVSCSWCSLTLFIYYRYHILPKSIFNKKRPLLSVVCTFCCFSLKVAYWSKHASLSTFLIFTTWNGVPRFIIFNLGRRRSLSSGSSKWSADGFSSSTSSTNGTASGRES